MNQAKLGDSTSTAPPVPVPTPRSEPTIAPAQILNEPADGYTGAGIYSLLRDPHSYA